MLTEYSSYYAKNCIDDDPYTTCSTFGGTNPWLSVELLATAPTVTGVEVYNPHYTDNPDYTGALLKGAWGSKVQNQHTVWQRLRDFEVWVGSSSGHKGTLCVAATAPATEGPFVHACNTATGIVGKFVTIKLPGYGRLLQLGEVRVIV